MALPDRSIDFVVTDPPFFDNVHYSELADFFYAWHQLQYGTERQTTRHIAEVQDADAHGFASKLQAILKECHRVLKDRGLLVFTYHHSRDEGWNALIDALVAARFIVVNSHPIKSEMSVATPKSQAKQPIQIDIILVCRKATSSPTVPPPKLDVALASARRKLQRLQQLCKLSRNDQRVVIYGQLLTTVRSTAETDSLPRLVAHQLASLEDTQDSFSSAPSPRTPSHEATQPEPPTSHQLSF